ncbi:hypothetical protein GE061_008507 [Apolygus lucorum]|uniref:Zinc finger PHD-type domain-containing protein n=1 Tax=Apolygus lucorum TaxID=248454 RepID=A0A8S9WKJ1_APOLU|nr:hypothetical protein GE061_008507 [Apolygus lucorum]
MEDGIAVKEEPMSEGDEDQEMEVEIKQEVLIGDEYVKEEVGNSRTDEDAGCPMIKQEDSSAADPLCDESDVLQGSIGVQRSEAGPALFIISTDDNDNDNADSCVHCNQHISEMALGDSWSICSVCSETAHDSCSGFDPDEGKPFVCAFCTDLVPQIHMK